jgi:hypothetical protein
MGLGFRVLEGISILGDMDWYAIKVLESMDVNTGLKNRVLKSMDQHGIRI